MMIPLQCDGAPTLDEALAGRGLDRKFLAKIVRGESVDWPPSVAEFDFRNAWEVLSNRPDPAADLVKFVTQVTNNQVAQASFTDHVRASMGLVQQWVGHMGQYNPTMLDGMVSFVTLFLAGGFPWPHTATSLTIEAPRGLEGWEDDPFSV